MIEEKKFFRVFKKNCKERLKTLVGMEDAIENLHHKGCPFPSVCQSFRPGGRGCYGCIGWSPDTPSCDCPISDEWQDNVFYFQKKKDDQNGEAMCEKMIKIIEEQMTKLCKGGKR